MMRWHQPNGPPEHLNYWSREIKCSLHHSFYKYNHLCPHRWKVFLLHTVRHILPYIVLYAVLYTLMYTVLHIALLTVLYTVLHIVRPTVLYTVLCIPYCIMSNVSSILCMLVIERQNRLFSNGNLLKDSPPMLKVMGH